MDTWQIFHYQEERLTRKWGYHFKGGDSDPCLHYGLCLVTPNQQLKS